MRIDNCFKVSNTQLIYNRWLKVNLNSLVKGPIHLYKIFKITEKKYLCQHSNGVDKHHKIKTHYTIN